MWDSDVDFDLAAFHSLVRALKRRLVQVVKVGTNQGGPLDPLGPPSSFELRPSMAQQKPRDFNELLEITLAPACNKR